MTATPQDAAPILDDAEAGSRRELLAMLQAALADLGIASILARKHRLVLRYADGLAGPNGLTDPELHVLGPATIRVITTDGTAYQLGSTRECPAADPAAAATLIAGEPGPAADPPATAQ